MKKNNNPYDENVESKSNEEYQIKEYDITASPNDFNLKTLFDFIESGTLIIPGFQRNYVWDIMRASKLIESILLGLPIPQIFLYEESRNRFLVIDGQQRLMSIYYFMKQRFPRKEKRVELRRIFGEHGRIPDEILENDAYFRKFNLSLTDYLPNQPNRYNKLNYSTLGDYKLSFDMRTVRNVIVKQNLPATDNTSVFEIFNRLNSGGINLTSQEIRASLYHSEFYNMLFRINNDPRWRKLLGTEEADIHMRDVEILLRSFAMLIDGDRYKPSMVKFLNSFSNKNKNLNKLEIEYLENLFKNFLENTISLSEKIFFNSRGRFATLFFEALFVASCDCSYRTKSIESEKFTKIQIQQLFDDAEFKNASKINTADSSNVETRLRRAKTILGI